MKLDYTHSPTKGKSIIEKIQDALDKELSTGDPSRAEGIALALGILRGSSEASELHLSEARTGLQ